MFDFVNYSSEQIIVLLLVIIRTTGLFLMVPVFSDKSLPKLIKLGLAIVLSLLMVSIIPSVDHLPQVNSTWQLIGLGVNELLIGLIIGMVFRFLFTGILLAGSIAGYQMGLMFANMFDKDQNSQVSVISRFWYVIAILFFLAINGHHMIINSLAESFMVIPLGNLNAAGSGGEMLIKYSGYIFIIAVKIVSPIMITLFLIDISLGTIAKMMPTMNVFFVGMPVKISVGVFMMALSLPLFVYVIEKALGYMDSELRLILYAIGEA